MNNLENRVATIEERLNLKTKRLDQWIPNVKISMYGVDPSVEVTIRELLTLRHNRIMYQCYLIDPVKYSDWQEQLEPVQGIEQKFEVIEPPPG
ncbi:MAG TPA: hypothetical protein VJ964_08975 [Balneolaceae bacterium]|nr:hypothetical protein [Balneolaceae bacterium]